VAAFARRRAGADETTHATRRGAGTDRRRGGADETNRATAGRASADETTQSETGSEP
jgi:hypothetical protein